MWDVFISHASEDKEDIAKPLADALAYAGLKVWYDNFTLQLGDSLRRAIDRGLAESRYGIVILSPNFFAKAWAQRELDGLTVREVSTGKTILPVWHRVTRPEVERFSPILADKLGVSTDRGLDVVVREILNVIRPKEDTHGDENEKKDHASVATHEVQERQPTKLLAEAEKHLEDGRYQEALEKTTKIVQRDPRNAEALAIRASALGGLGRYREAVEVATTALTYSALNTRALVARAFSYGSLGKQADAIRDAMTVLQNTNTLRTPRNLLDRSAAYFLLGQYDEALQEIGEVMRTEPRSLRVLAVQTSLYVTLGRYNDALQSATEALQIAPNNPRALMLRGMTLGYLGRPLEVVRDLTAVLTIEPHNGEALANRAIAYGQLGRWNDAIQDTTEALKYDAQNIRALMTRASVYGQLGRYSDAAQDAAEVLRIKPGDPFALNVLRAASAESRHPLMKFARAVFNRIKGS